MKDGYKCKLFGATPQDGAKLHVDNIVPLGKRMGKHFKNLQIFCDKCNIGKSDIELDNMSFSTFVCSRTVSENT